MNDTKIEHDIKIKVQVEVTLEDLKLLKNMTTIGIPNKYAPSSNPIHRLHFVIQNGQWWAWSTDSYILALTKFHTNVNYKVRTDDSVNRINAVCDNLVASVSVTDFAQDVTDINKYYKKEDINGNAYLEFDGYAKKLPPKTKPFEDMDIVVGGRNDITIDFVNIKIENAPTYSVLNRGDVVKKARDMFLEFSKDVPGALEPDKRRPITHIQYSPTHLKKVMNFLTFNRDDHFTYMYNYDGVFADAVLFEKTCSGTDTATEKFAWIMPQRSEHDIQEEE